MSNEIGYLAEQIFKQNVEGAAWYLVTTYSKNQEEKDELKKELLNKTQPELGKAVSLSVSESRASAESQVCCALQESGRGGNTPKNNGVDTCHQVGLEGRTSSPTGLFLSLKV